MGASAWYGSICKYSCRGFRHKNWAAIFQNRRKLSEHPCLATLVTSFSNSRIDSRIEHRKNRFIADRHSFTYVLMAGECLIPKHLIGNACYDWRAPTYWWLIESFCLKPIRRGNLLTSLCHFEVNIVYIAHFNQDISANFPSLRSCVAGVQTIWFVRCARLHFLS